MTQLCEQAGCEKAARYHIYVTVDGGIYLCKEHYVSYMQDYVPIERRK